MLGAGNYSTVRSGSKREAIKKVPLLTGNAVFLNESFIIPQTKSCTRTIKYKKTYVENNEGYIVMERAKCNLVECLLKRKGAAMAENKAAHLFYLICQSVKELHESRIAHLDLKLDNFLLTNEGHVKICDFGCSVNFSQPEDMIDHPNFKIGSPMYCAPEIESKGKFCPMQADMWSLGVILHLLLTDCFPTSEPVSYITEDTIYFENLENRSDEAKDLVANLLFFDPTLRYSMEEVLNSPWLVKHLSHNVPDVLPCEDKPKFKQVLKHLLTCCKDVLF